MKAVICTGYGPPEMLRLTTIDKPVPKDNEICIKIYATTVTAADFRIRSFTVPPAFWLPARLALGIFKPRNPVLGVEFAGEIESTGKNVTRFKKGDQVFAAALKSAGGYADYKCMPEDGAIALKPVNTTFEEAAAIPIGARTALYFLKKGNIGKGQKVLIYGASGSVGTYAVQLAKYFGAHVTGVCSSANLDMVASLGADKVIDYTTGDLADKLEIYDMIFLAVDKCPFAVCNKALADNGVYVNITSPLKTPQMLRASITGKKKFITGGGPSDSAEDLVTLKELVEAGVLKPVIDRNYPLDQIVAAHRYVDQGHKKGNVTITVQSPPSI